MVFLTADSCGVLKMGVDCWLLQSSPYGEDGRGTNPALEQAGKGVLSRIASKRPSPHLSSLPIVSRSCLEYVGLSFT